MFAEETGDFTSKTRGRNGTAAMFLRLLTLRWVLYLAGRLSLLVERVLNQTGTPKNSKEGLARSEWPKVWDKTFQTFGLSNFRWIETKRFQSTWWGGIPYQIISSGPKLSVWWLDLHLVSQFWPIGCRSWGLWSWDTYISWTHYI